MSEAELDHIASGIRPSWELDDAPFRPGGLASPELEALLAAGTSLSASGSGVAHSHTNGAAGAITAQRVVSLNAPEPEDMLTRVDPIPPTHVLEDAPIAPVRVEAAAAAPLPVPQVVAQAVAQAVAQPPAPTPQSNRPPPPSVKPPPPVQVASSRPPPPNGVAVSAQADPFAAPEKAKPKTARAKSTSSADFPAIQKSNKGLYIALGGGAVAALVAIVVFSSSGKTDATKVSASPTPSQMPGTSTTHEIPPPPATDDLPPATAKATTAQTAAPTATQIDDLPATTAAATQAAVTPPTPTHASHADTSPAPTHHSSPPAHSNPPASGGSGKGKGGIVRDVPF